MSSMSLHRWGALASFLLVSGFIVAPLIYLVGDLQEAFGPFAYSIADFLYGPLWAASLGLAFVALRERIGDVAPRRTKMALLAALLAAGMMVLVASIRSANRQYHLLHPELALETSTEVLVAWTTLVAGVTGAGWHFLGWALVLIGSAGLASGRIPIALCGLYTVGGVVSLLVYVFPTLEGSAALLGVLWAVWQGILLWRGEPGKKIVSDDRDRQPNSNTTS